MKTGAKTDWEARFAREVPLTIKTIEKPFAGIPAGARMLIVTPRMVDAAVRRLPPGARVTPAEIRQSLAAEHGADHACPVTTGLALRVVAERAYQRLAAGETDVTPFWRAIEADSDLVRKLACGREFIVRRQEQEAQ